MSRYSLNSTLALFQSVLSDPDATSSSTSSSSAINNSSNSLSVSPAIERQQQQHHDNIRLSNINIANHAAAGNSKQQTISNHLLELQREIKEEEDEIFADIDSLINNRADLYSSLNDAAAVATDYEDINDNLVDDLNCQFDSNNTSSRAYLNFSEDEVGANYGHDDGDSTTRIDIEDGENLVTTTTLATRHQQQQQQQHPQFSHIHNQQRYNSSATNNRSFDLLSTRVNDGGQEDDDDGEDFRISSSCNRADQQQRKQEPQRGAEAEPEVGDDNDDEEEENNNEQHKDLLQQFQQQQLQNSQAMQQVTSNLPKPCVFFLEGNCRRSDCKYSHDLSSITCKYWIEGFCFKGEMCPFLHSFASNNLQDTSLFDDDGLALSKKDLTPKFVIESEADFPSLPLDAPPGVTLGDGKQKNADSSSLTKTIKNQILSSNPAVVFKSTKKKRKKG